MASILRTRRKNGRYQKMTIIKRTMIHPTAFYMNDIDIYNFFRSFWHFLNDNDSIARWINDDCAFRIINPERFYQEGCPKIWEGCTREYFEHLLSACKFELISSEFKDYSNFVFTKKDFGRLRNIKATRPVPSLRVFLQQSKDFHSEVSSDQITSTSKASTSKVLLQTSLGPHSDASSTSEDSSTKIMSEEEIHSFFKNLLEIISDYQYQYFSIVRWIKKGRIFKIVDFKGFNEEICPMLCEGCTPKYFKYVLDSCEFLSIPPDYVDFYHVDFMDEEFERLKNIKPKIPVRKPKTILKPIITYHPVPSTSVREESGTDFSSAAISNLKLYEHTKLYESSKNYSNASDPLGTKGRSIEARPIIDDIASWTAEQNNALQSTTKTINVLQSTAETINVLQSTVETINVLQSSEGNSSSTESIPDQPKSDDESTLSCPSEGMGTPENPLPLNAETPPHEGQDASTPAP